jgi:hypothetical protein
MRQLALARADHDFEHAGPFVLEQHPVRAWCGNDGIERVGPRPGTWLAVIPSIRVKLLPAMIAIVVLRECA